MPRYKQPRSAKARDRQFWSWSKLRCTRAEKDAFITNILNGLYNEGLLQLDFRRSAHQSLVDGFLATELRSAADAFRQLHAKREEDFRRRLRLVITSRKRDFLSVKAQQARVLSTQTSEEQNDAPPPASEHGLQGEGAEVDTLPAPEERDPPVPGTRSQAPVMDILEDIDDIPPLDYFAPASEQESLAEDANIGPSYAPEQSDSPAQENEDQAPYIDIFKGLDDIPSRDPPPPAEGRKPEGYSTIERLPVELIEIIGQTAGFAALQTLSLTSRTLRNALKHQRRKLRTINPLPRRVDYRAYTQETNSTGDELIFVPRFRTLPGAETVEQPMAWAIQNGMVGLLRDFMWFSASPNSVSLFGNSMLHVAVIHNQRECVQVLIESGVKRDSLDPGTGTTALLTGLIARSEAALELFPSNPEPVFSSGEVERLRQHAMVDPALRQWLEQQGLWGLRLEDWESDEVFYEQSQVYTRPSDSD